MYARPNGGTYELKVFTGPLTGEESGTPAISSLSPGAVVRGSTNVTLTVAGTIFHEWNGHIVLY